MLDQGTQFLYFKSILKEVYTIIEINWKMKDTDTEKLIEIIGAHLDKYNSKNGLVRMGYDYDNERQMIFIYLSDYVIGRGLKKRFQDEIAIKSIIRDKLIDDLLSEDDDDIMENYM